MLALTYPWITIGLSGVYASAAKNLLEASNVIILDLVLNTQSPKTL
jgi:ribosome biogenesis SPOUT family RNA methylase Rps3